MCSQMDGVWGHKCFINMYNLSWKWLLIFPLSFLLNVRLAFHRDNSCISNSANGYCRSLRMEKGTREWQVMHYSQGAIKLEYQQIPFGTVNTQETLRNGGLFLTARWKYSKRLPVAIFLAVIHIALQLWQIKEFQQQWEVWVPQTLDGKGMR